jgi:hypothetical protein
MGRAIPTNVHRVRACVHVCTARVYVCAPVPCVHARIWRVGVFARARVRVAV